MEYRSTHICEKRCKPKWLSSRLMVIFSGEIFNINKRGELKHLRNRIRNIRRIFNFVVASEKLKNIHNWVTCIKRFYRREIWTLSCAFGAVKAL